MAKFTNIIRIIAMAVALIAVISVFLPFVSATKEGAETLDQIGDVKVFRTDDDPPKDIADITAKGLKGLSLFNFGFTYIQGGAAIENDGTTAALYIIVISGIALFAILAILFTYIKKPGLVILFSILMGLFTYLMKWDFVDKKIMGSADGFRWGGVAFQANWGIALYLLYICAAVLLVLGIFMLRPQPVYKLFGKLTSKADEKEA